MAHMIYDNDMAYVGKTPWHGLGKKLTEGAPIETWCEQAGFNWQVIPKRVLFTDGNGNITEFPRRTVLHRSDTNAPLSIVSDAYKITQPSEVAEFFRDLVAAGGFHMETMGMLDGGKRYWALAKADDSLTLHGGDTVLPYLLLATSCDGSMASCADFTTVRVVCMNTLSAAIGSRGNRAKIRVPHSREFDAAEVKAELGITKETWSVFKGAATNLSKFTMSDDAVRKMFGIVMYGGKTEKEEAKITINRIMDVYKTGPGQRIQSASGTAWGAVNAITRYIDHERNARTQDAKLNYAWFGMGANIKNAAMDYAVKAMALAA